jgi:hypothetical protein
MIVTFVSGYAVSLNAQDMHVNCVQLRKVTPGTGAEF